jgi:hypothetical protein
MSGTGPVDALSYTIGFSGRNIKRRQDERDQTADDLYQDLQDEVQGDGQQQGQRKRPRPNTQPSYLARSFALPHGVGYATFNGAVSDARVIVSTHLEICKQFQYKDILTTPPLRNDIHQAFTAQCNAYFRDLRGAAHSIYRQWYPPTTHHTQRVGKEVAMVLGNQIFMNYGKPSFKGAEATPFSEEMAKTDPKWFRGNGYMKESEIDWIEHAVTSGFGDSVWWGPDDKPVGEVDVKLDRKCGMESSITQMEVTGKDFMKFEGVENERNCFNIVEPMKEIPGESLENWEQRNRSHGLRLLYVAGAFSEHLKGFPGEGLKEEVKEGGEKEKAARQREEAMRVASLYATSTGFAGGPSSLYRTEWSPGQEIRWLG